MAEATAPQPIIVKKIIKVAAGHHGGAWKVAYADFVTAMMAFFLLLWLLNAVTEEQLSGIANYFSPVSVSDKTSGAGGMLAGQTMADSGAMRNIMAQPSISIDIPPPEFERKSGDEGEDMEENAGKEEMSEEEAAAAEAEKRREQQESEQFAEAEEALREAIEAVPQLKQLSSSLLVDETSEGLRIQIIDQEGLAMFPRGSSAMYTHTRKVFELVAQVIVEMPQQIAISGFTDSTKYSGRTDYGNWELSADRANATRRVLIEKGLSSDRIARVVGKADMEPLLPDDPTNAKNRRISLILLRGTGYQPPPPPILKPEEPAGEQNPFPNLKDEETPGEGVIPAPPHIDG